ncbi:hypothetical protein CRG98_025052 [Punica granatum]|uniref:Uncharacterized protein n=1 Tax=Punica granatum TaxID=22663 RepID=A0A2I0JE61_PUNGR|nr:hypothetical protein CRG98_025052 [Punica granatum]
MQAGLAHSSISHFVVGGGLTLPLILTLPHRRPPSPLALAVAVALFLLAGATISMDLELSMRVSLQWPAPLENLCSTRAEAVAVVELRTAALLRRRAWVCLRRFRKFLFEAWS